MSVLSLLNRLKEAGIKIRHVNGELKVTASKGKLTPGLIDELKNHKEEIIGFLQESSRKRVKYASIECMEKKEYYLLSSAQKRLFLVNRLKGNDTSDNTPRAFLIDGTLNRQYLEDTIHRLILRQEILRTSFEMVEDQPVQRVHESISFNISDVKGDDNPEPQDNECIQRIIYRFIRPFDLGQAPLMRMGLLKLTEQSHLLICDMHHIINDAVSQQLFYIEFIDLYAGINLPPLRIQYKDFAAWQNYRLNSGLLKQQEQYWLNVFSGEIPRLNMPTDYPRPAVQSFEGSFVEFKIEQNLTVKLHEIISPIGATLHMAMFCIFNILLYVYTGQEDIIVGSSGAGRPHADLHNVIGFFVNTLTIRSYPGGEKTFIQFLGEVKDNILKAVENQDYQFDDLVNRLGIQRDPARQALFDTHFTLHSLYLDSLQIGADSSKKVSSTKFTPYNVEEQITQFDIIVHAFENNDNIYFSLRYCTKLFKKETMERFVDYYREITRAVVENKHIKLKDIDISHNLETARANMPQADFNF